MSPFLLPAVRNSTHFLALTALLAFSATSARAIDITECGQLVPKRKVANLIGDLNCSEPIASAHAAVELESRATLNLNGFSLLGPEGGPSSSFGVFCYKKCNVNGPGTIARFSVGIRGLYKLVRVTDVIINGASKYGLDGCRFKVTRSIISGASQTGISAACSVSLAGVKVIDSSVSDNGGNGILSNKVRLRNATVTGNGENGVSTAGSGGRRRHKVNARDSEIVDNGIDCPPEAPCYDIKIDGYKAKARLRNTTFGTCEPAFKCRSR